MKRNVSLCIFYLFFAAEPNLHRTVTSVYLNTPDSLALLLLCNIVPQSKVSNRTVLALSWSGASWMFLMDS